MEPTNLNPLPADDAQLDAWLSRQASLPPLPDDGFSNRVINALPPPVDPRLLENACREKRAEIMRRRFFCAMGATTGLIVYLIQVNGGLNLAGLWDSLAGFQFNLMDALSAMGTATITLASLALVYWKQLKALRRHHA